MIPFLASALTCRRKVRHNRIMSLTSRRFCKRCRAHREVNWRNPGTLDYCPSCIRARSRGELTLAQREARTREADSKKRRSEETLAWIDNFKRSRGCARCGETDPRALDCHADPAAKAINIAGLVRRRPNLAFVAKQLGGSVVLCASCQRKEPRQTAEAETVQQQLGSRSLRSTVSFTAAPGRSEQPQDVRRVLLVGALGDVNDALEVLHSRELSPQEAAKRRAELDDRRRALSVELMKLDAVTPPTLVEQPTDEVDEDLL